MILTNEDINNIKEFLEEFSQGKTAREILDCVKLQLEDDPKTTAFSKVLNKIDGIKRVLGTPYKYKIIVGPGGEEKFFTWRWKKEKNIIKFELQHYDSEEFLEYDFNKNDFLNYDEKNVYSGTNDLINCFLQKKPITQLEWIFNYPNKLSDGCISKLITDEVIKNYKKPPKGYINFIENNDLDISEKSINLYVQMQKLDNILNRRQKNKLYNIPYYYQKNLVELLLQTEGNIMKVFSNSIKEFEFIRLQDTKDFYYYCKKLQDYTIDTNRTLYYNMENKKQLLDEKKFEMLSQKLQKLNFLNNIIIDDYIIKVPQNLFDLQEEGKNQNNCVGSHYNNDIIKGRDLIYFLREKNSPDKSYITCRYNKKYKKTIEHKTKNNNSTNKEQEQIIEIIDEMIKERLGG